jgi:hypothetical protein
MPRFLTPIRLESITTIDRDTWVICEPCDYALGDEHGAEHVLIPKDFETDFASIPRLLQNVLSPIGRYRNAAIVHDWLYRQRVITDVVAKKARLCERIEADRVLLEGMRVLGVRWTQRAAVYAGVRVGGWMAWRQARRRELAAVKLSAG